MKKKVYIKLMLLLFRAITIVFVFRGTTATRMEKIDGINAMTCIGAGASRLTNQQILVQAVLSKGYL